MAALFCDSEMLKANTVNWMYKYYLITLNSSIHGLFVLKIQAVKCIY